MPERPPTATILYLMGCLAEKSRDLRTLRAVRAAADAEGAQKAIAEALPSVVASALSAGEYEALHLRLAALPEQPRLGREDWLVGLSMALLGTCLSALAMALGG